MGIILGLLLIIIIVYFLIKKSNVREYNNGSRIKMHHQQSKNRQREVVTTKEIAEGLCELLFAMIDDVRKDKKLNLDFDVEPLFMCYSAMYRASLSRVVPDNNINIPKNKLNSVKMNLKTISINIFQNKYSRTIDVEAFKKEQDKLYRKVSKIWRDCEDFPPSPHWHVAKELCNYLKIAKEDILWLPLLYLFSNHLHTSYLSIGGMLNDIANSLTIQK